MCHFLVLFGIFGNVSLVIMEKINVNVTFKSLIKKFSE
jgi:hypothetical protein